MSIADTIPATYRAKFPSVQDLEGIARQAEADQQAGISVMTGRALATTTVAEGAHYTNMWMTSMQVNGTPKQFAR